MDELPRDILKLIFKFSVNNSIYHVNKKNYSMITKRKINLSKGVSARQLIMYTSKLKDTLIELNLQNCHLIENALSYVNRLYKLEVLNIIDCTRVKYCDLDSLYKLNNLKKLYISTKVLPRRMIELFRSNWENKYNLQIIIKKDTIPYKFPPGDYERLFREIKHNHQDESDNEIKDRISQLTIN